MRGSEYMSGGNAKILIIEDDWNFQSLMSVFLCEHGYEVQSADSGRTGLKKALCYKPDLILLDYDLGDMSAKEAAFWLEYMRGTRTIPLLLLSGLTGDPEVSGAMKKYSRCKGVLSKQQLLEKILEAVEGELSSR